MGRSKRGRQGSNSPPLVAFDFDGTLSWRDCFIAFLAWRSRPLSYAVGLIRLAPAAIAYLFDRDRGRLKAAAVGIYLRGISREELVAECEAFARSPLGRRMVRPDAEQCWLDWRRRGARLAIVSAAPEDVLQPFARELGADVVIATRLAFTPDGRVRGDFDGENCRGPEKVRRLRALFGSDVRLAAAYGDTSGDREMLAIAEIKGYRVFKARR
jgi:phosphatidylglycerophosphatase C